MEYESFYVLTVAFPFSSHRCSAYWQSGVKATSQRCSGSSYYISQCHWNSGTGSKFIHVQMERIRSYGRFLNEKRFSRRSKTFGSFSTWWTEMTANNFIGFGLKQPLWTAKRWSWRTTPTWVRISHRLRRWQSVYLHLQDFKACCLLHFHLPVLSGQMAKLLALVNSNGP